MWDRFSACYLATNLFCLVAKHGFLSDKPTGDQITG